MEKEYKHHLAYFRNGDESMMNDGRMRVGVQECESSLGGEVKMRRVRSRELAEILDPSEAVGSQVNERGGGWPYHGLRLKQWCYLEVCFTCKCVPLAVDGKSHLHKPVQFQ